MTRFSEASPLKVSEETHRRVRLAAAVAGETMGSIVEIAVGEFMEAGADLLVANLDAIKAGQTPLTRLTNTVK